MRDRPLVFLFSGQGSHYYGMGRPLFESHPVFRRWMEWGDERVRELLGESVLATLYAPGRGPGEPLDRLAVTHPALFLFQYALFQTLRGLGLEPKGLLGASLGEIAAAAAAGAVSFDDALAAVVRQAELVERLCPPGGMVAVLGPPALHGELPLLRDHTELAGVHYDEHFVVAAEWRTLEEIPEVLRARGVLFQELAVSRAFHSRWLDPAGPAFRAALAGLALAAPRVPLTSCAYGGVLSHLPEGFLWEAVRRPIRFREALRSLEAGGERVYVDLGPAGTLATFARYNLGRGAAARCLPVATPFGQDLRNLEAVARLAEPS